MQNVVPLFSSESPTAFLGRVSFARAIALASAIAPPKGPALMRLSSTPQGMIVTAAGSGIEINIALAGEVDARFSAVLPIDAVARLAKKAPRSDVVALRMIAKKTDGDEPAEDARFASDKVELAFGHVSFALDSVPADDFPAQFQDEPADLFAIKVPSSIFWNAIDGTVQASSTEETRYYLNGVFMHSIEGKLAFAATDGHRLFMQATNVKAPAALAGILPTKVAKFLDTLLNGYAGARDIEIQMNADFINVSFDGVIMRANMVDGTFPDYQRVIPSEPACTAEVKAGPFLESLQALTAVAPRRSVRLHFEPGKCRLSVADPEVGAAGADIECSYEGDAFDIGFDAGYLTTTVAMASPDGRSIRIGLTSADKAIVVTGSISGWSGVLMPTAA